MGRFNSCWLEIKGLVGDILDYLSCKSIYSIVCIELLRLTIAIILELAKTTIMKTATNSSIVLQFTSKAVFRSFQNKFSSAIIFLESLFYIFDWRSFIIWASFFWSARSSSAKILIRRAIEQRLFFEETTNRECSDRKDQCLSIQQLRESLFCLCLLAMLA